MKKVQIKERSIIFASSLGTAIALCASIIFSLTIPIIILNGTIRDNEIQIIVPIIQFISSFLGIFAATKFVKENKLLVMGVSAGMYLLVLICVALLFFDGLSTKVVTGPIAILAGVVSAAMIVCKKKKRGRGKRAKNGNR